MNLENIGVKLNKTSSKIIGGYSGQVEHSSVKNIYAIGDILEEAPMLTSTATKTGKLLGETLVNEIKNKTTNKIKNVNWDNVPGTVFSNPEY